MHDDLSEEPTQHQEKLPWWKQNISLLILTGMFALMAMLVPVDIIDRIKDLFKVEPVNISAPFQQETARLDAALEEGSVVPDRESLRARRHDIIVRRLLRAGPLNGEDVRQIKVMLAEIDEQTTRETSPQAIEAWRALRLKKLAQGYPRLDAKKLEAVLHDFEAQYESAMGAGEQ